MSDMAQPEASAAKSMELSSAENTVLSSACQIFEGSKDQKGYGLKRYKGKLYRAHRLTWLLTRGEIPEGYLVCHRCDNPSCVNVDHLFLGTPKDNTTDMINKKRQGIFTGELNGFSKLKEQDVLYIRSNTRKCPQKVLAKQFNVSQTTISDIQLGKIWKHI